MTRPPIEGHAAPAPAPRADFGALLAALRHAPVDFVVVGPVAARARGVDVSDLGRLGAVVDLTPSPEDGNLARLADALCACGARLRCPDETARLPITLHPGIFADLPSLPLASDLGDVNVLLRPTAAPPSYAQLRAEAPLVDLDGVGVAVPTVQALMRGLVAGLGAPHPTLLERLRTAQTAATIAATALVRAPVPAADADDDATLQHVLLEVLGRLDRPASVRELLFAISGWRRLPYKRVKAAAEALTARGQLVRDKDGTAHRYRRNGDDTEWVARDIAAALESVTDPDKVVRLALERVGRGPR